jgi:hypothetical protein
VELIIGRRIHIHIWEATTVGERDMKALRGYYTLLTTLTPWDFVNLSAEWAQLTSRMDSVSLSLVSILMKEDDGWPMMSVNESSSGHKRRLIKSGLPNSGDLSLVDIQCRNETNVRASHTTIDTSIHEKAHDSRSAMVG